MKSSPCIDFEEFDQFSLSENQNGYVVIQRNHPEFGNWKENSLNLAGIRIVEHKASLNHDLSVKFSNETLQPVVSHCISLGGFFGAHFSQRNVEINLKPLSYHYMTSVENEYRLNMGKTFHNIHMEVDRDHYFNILSDSEEWSARLKETLQQDFYYPGAFNLSQEMIHVIHSIFNSPLSGSLKKLLIEAKVQELIALQLNGSLVSARDKSNPTKYGEVIHAVRNYLSVHFLEVHSLKQICLQFGINEYTLKKEFKRAFSTTVFEFILSRRLEHARDLLMQSDQSIQEIASAVGYMYPNHFSSAFKNKFGVNPKAIRSKN